MVPLERAVVALHSDHCNISDYSAAICRQMSPTLKFTRVGHFWANLGRKGSTHVSQILTRSGRDIGLSYAKEIV